MKSRTPDGKWTVETIHASAGSAYRVQRGECIGTRTRHGWAPTGRLFRSVGQVEALLGDDFTKLIPPPGNLR